MKNDATKEQAALFSALADPTRLKLLKLLCSQHEPDALCVGALTGLLGVSQPAVSQHLRVLRSAGLVKGERRGYRVHYTVDTEALKRVRDLTAAATAIGEQEKDDPCETCPDDSSGKKAKKK